MKRFCLALLLTASLVGGVRAADEVVYVDLQEVFKGFYKTQLAQDQVRQQQADIKLERSEMEDVVKGLKEEIDALRTDARDETLSEDIRDGKRNQLEEKLVELQKKEQEMVEFEQLRTQQLEQQNSRMTKKIYDEVRDAIVNFAKAKNYAAVVDRSAQSRIGTEMVLYASPKMDITADVLAALNEGRGEELIKNLETQKEEQE